MGRIVGGSRYLVLIAVVASLIAAAGAFIWGAWSLVLLFQEIVVTGGKSALIAVSFLELMDKFLIATGLLIFAAGMYELFFGELTGVKWLNVHSLHDIKSRLVSIIILVMAIAFAERVVAWQDAQSTLFFGLAVAVVSGVLIAFSYIGARE